ncbi:MAG: hypothetical protein M1828_007534, partial [Chrysothrix sp. TS-e1954]
MAAHGGVHAHGHQTQLGSRPFNHEQSSHAESRYDDLRRKAREAGSRGDHGGQEHWNQQASDFIFLENNSMDRVAADTIDLHGQYVHEAERILEKRILAARAQGQNHLHVIVGKGNHSPGHIQKIKPCVERLCQEHGLQYATEHNAGRIYVNLQGQGINVPAENQWDHVGGYNAHQQPQHQQYHSHQQQHNYQHQQGQGYAGYPGQQQTGYPGSPPGGYPAQQPMGYSEPQQGGYQGQQQDQ